MYYHPLLVNTHDNARLLDTCRAFADVWLDAAAQQREIHRNAIVAFCSAQAESLHAMSEADDATAVVAAQLLASAVSEPLRALTLAAQLAEAAADSHRRAVAVLDLHVDAASERRKPKNAGRARSVPATSGLAAPGKRASG